MGNGSTHGLVDRRANCWYPRQLPTSNPLNNVPVGSRLRDELEKQQLPQIAYSTPRFQRSEQDDNHRDECDERR